MLFKCVLINCVLPWELYIHVIKVKIHTLHSGFCLFAFLFVCFLLISEPVSHLGGKKKINNINCACSLHELSGLQPYGTHKLHHFLNFALELNVFGGKRPPFEFIPVICTKRLAVEPVARIHHPHCLPNGRKVLVFCFVGFFCVCVLMDCWVE